MNTPTVTATKPNIVLITTDDMRATDLKWMPNTRRLLNERGVTFTDAISPYTLCCPARATLMTGQYNHNNHVRGNNWPNGGYWRLDRRGNTLPVWLREGGYRTGFVGKYTNGYGKKPKGGPPDLRERLHLAERREREVPPGWIRWYGSVNKVYRYEGVGMWVKTPRQRPHLERKPDIYQTSYFTRVAVDMIERFHQADNPFFMWVSHLAPHTASVNGDWRPPIPRANDRGSHDGIHLPLRKDRIFRQRFNEDDMTDKRGPVRNLDRIGSKKQERIRWNHQRRLESLKSVDRSVRRIVRRLKSTGEYQRTVIIFASDNGYALGEHRIVLRKDMPYDATLKIPMIVSAPGIKQRYQPGATATDRVRVPYTVTIHDIPATIVAAADVDPGRRMDGIDMRVPRANPDHDGGDRAVLFESGPTGSEYRPRHAKFVGVRTDRWTWFGWQARLPRSGDTGTIRYTRGIEMYDDHGDRAQVDSVYRDRRGSRISKKLRELVRQMHDCRGHGTGVNSCRRSWTPPS